MKPKLRRIRRWLWNGAAVVSLTMLAIALLLWAESHWRMHVVSCEHTAVSDSGSTILDDHPSFQFILNDGIVGFVWDDFNRSPNMFSIHHGSIMTWLPPVWKYEQHASKPGHIFGMLREYCEFTFFGAEFHSDPDFAYLRLPLWIPIITFAILPTLWLIFWYRGRYKRLPNHCQSCGYNLTGTLAAGRSECPECGEATQHTLKR